MKKFRVDEEMDNVLNPYEAELREEEEKSQRIIYHKADEALVKSLIDYGKINLTYMASYSGMTRDELISALKGKGIWQDPQIYDATKNPYEGYMTKEALLGVNRIKTLRTTRVLNDKYDGLFNDNIKLLEDNLPEKIDEIHINPGSPFIKPEYIAAFLKDLHNTWLAPEVSFDKKWHIRFRNDPDEFTTYSLYGIRDNRKHVSLPSYEIFKRLMNNSPIVVKVLKEVNGKDKYVTDMDLTLAAKEKAKQLEEQFKLWLKDHPSITEAIEEDYCECFSFGNASFNGAFLPFEDLNPNVKLYSYQKDAVARILFSPSTMLCHQVGAGKTYIFVAAVHELKRMGLSSKNLLVIQNNNFEEVVARHQEMYPDDRLLAISPTNFKPANQAELLRQVKEEDFDAIYIAASSFDMINFTKKWRLDHIEAMGKTNKSYQLYKKLLKEKEELKKLPDSPLYCFDELGITCLVVDESQNYKNIAHGIYGRVDGLTGLSSQGSERANLMLEKVHYVKDQGGKIVFASGTPLSNSIADLFTIQVYLQMDTLKECEIDTLPMWLNTFCKRQEIVEVDLKGSLRNVVRYPKFYNLPELRAIFSQIADGHVEALTYNLPDYTGYTDIEVDPTPLQEKLISEFPKRIDAIKARKVPLEIDNMFKVTYDGRCIALSPGILAPLTPTDLGKATNRIKVCANEILNIYQSYPGTTQLVFCDCSVPKKGYNVYDHLKSELMDKGIPKDEIAYIHDGTTPKKKETIIKAFNKGELRVLIGSTIKLGTGLNVQEKTKALHHLDIPWKPSELEQREGRIIRQNNSNSEVFVYRYITKRSFDSYLWQIIERKQLFIQSFIAGTLDPSKRDADDLSETVLSSSVAKALAIGDKKIRKILEAKNELDDTKIKRNAKKKELEKLERECNKIPAQIARKKQLIDSYRKDRDFYERHKQPMSRMERKDYGKDLLAALQANEAKPYATTFGWYQDFQISLPAHMVAEQPYVILKGTGVYKHSVKMNSDKPLGLCQTLDYALGGGLKDKIWTLSKEVTALKAAFEEAEETIAKGNPYEEQVKIFEQKLAKLESELQITA